MTGEEKQNNSGGNKAPANQQTEKKSIGQAISETRKELKKVQWPKKEEIQKYTVVTLITVAFFSVAIYIIDSGLGFVISKLVN